MARKNKNKNKNGDGMELAAVAVTPPVVEHDAGDESHAAPAAPPLAAAATGPGPCDTCAIVSHLDAAIAEAERSIAAGDPRFAISRGLRMLREARKSFSRAA